MKKSYAQFELLDNEPHGRKLGVHQVSGAFEVGGDWDSTHAAAGEGHDWL